MSFPYASDAARLAMVGRKLLRARMAEDAAYEEARIAAIKAIAEGVPEAVVARELGVNRMTVRKWEGKR
jgi:hypothetical protein